MTLEELMIGDWVRIKSDINSDDAYWMHDNMRPGQALKVEEILSNGINPDWYGGEINDYIPEDALMPIPLTPEILEKNGFKFESPCINDNKDAWVYEWPHEKPNHTPHVFLLMSHHNKARFPNFWICAPNDPDIVYVHQLQHALRLCGIDIDIKL